MMAMTFGQRGEVIGSMRLAPAVAALVPAVDVEGKDAAPIAVQDGGAKGGHRHPTRSSFASASPPNALC